MMETLLNSFVKLGTGIKDKENLLQVKLFQEEKNLFHISLKTCNSLLTNHSHAP
jgi:hypothetical protein